MTFSDFTLKLNWRLMTAHVLACWFLFHAFWQLGFLYDYSYLEEVKHHFNDQNYNNINNYRNLDAVRITMIPFHAAMIGLIGILCSFVLSISLSLKYKWLWANSVIVLLVTLMLFCLDRFYYGYLRHVFHFPGRFFNSDWASILANSSVMLAIGLLLFFLKRMIKFIDGDNPVRKQGREQSFE